MASQIIINQKKGSSDFPPGNKMKEFSQLHTFFPYVFMFCQLDNISSPFFYSQMRLKMKHSVLCIGNIHIHNRKMMYMNASPVLYFSLTVGKYVR